MAARSQLQKNDIVEAGLRALCGLAVSTMGDAKIEKAI